MTITPNQLILYGATDMVYNNTSTVGGAVDFSIRVDFSDPPSAQAFYCVSSSPSDTLITNSSGNITNEIIITIAALDDGGTSVLDQFILNGTAPVIGSSSASIQRLKEGIVTGTAVGDLVCYSSIPIVTGTAQGGANTSGVNGPTITLESGQGASVAINQIVMITTSGEPQFRRIMAISGDVITVNNDWSTVPSSTTTYTINAGMLFEQNPTRVSQIIRPFFAIQSNPTSSVTYYTKIFAVNTNPTLTLSNAGINFILGNIGNTQIGIAAMPTLNDTGSVANRLTAPDLGNIDGGAFPNYFSAGPANSTISMLTNTALLPGGAAPNTAGAQAIWLEAIIPAGEPPYEGLISIGITGNSV